MVEKERSVCTWEFQRELIGWLIFFKQQYNICDIWVYNKLCFLNHMWIHCKLDMWVIHLVETLDAFIFKNHNKLTKERDNTKSISYWTKKNIVKQNLFVSRMVRSRMDILGHHHVDFCFILIWNLSPTVQSFDDWCHIHS